nr:hypothetical protein [Desulfuromonadales bacterium]
ARENDGDHGKGGEQNELPLPRYVEEQRKRPDDTGRNAKPHKKDPWRRKFQRK